MFQNALIYFIFLNRKLLCFGREEREGVLKADFSYQSDRANFDAALPFLACHKPQAKYKTS